MNQQEILKRITSVSVGRIVVDPQKLAQLLFEWHVDVETPPEKDKDTQSWEAIESDIHNSAVEMCIEVANKKRERKIWDSQHRELLDKSDLITALEDLKK